MSFVKRIFGGGDRVANIDTTPLFTSANLTAPGFSLGGKLSGSNFNTTFERTGSPAQDRFDARFPRLFGELDTLKSTLTPGFSNLRKSALGRFDSDAAAFSSNLRDNLARRRVQGSSFAANTLGSAEAEFAQRRAAVEGQSFLAELEANRQLIRQEAELLGQELERDFAELQVAAGFGQNMANIIARNAQANIEAQLANAKLRAEADAGVGKFLGSLAGLATSQFGEGGIFNSGGGSTGGKNQTGAAVGNAAFGPAGGWVGRQLGGSL